MKIKVSAIMGNNFCGSTMFSFMLGNHPDTCSIGEVINIYRKKFLCSKCNTLIGGCKLVKHLEDNPLKDWYLYISKFVKKDNIVDSSKLAEWWGRLAGINIFEDKRYDIYPILLFKDPVRNIFSAYNHAKVGNPVRAKKDGFEQWAMNHGYNIFCQLNDVLDIVEKYTDRLIVIDYHNLCVHPEDVLKTVCEATGFPYREGMSRFWENKHHHSIAGNWSARSAFKDDPYDIEHPKLLDEVYVRNHKRVFLDDRYLNFGHKKINSILEDKRVLRTVRRLEEIAGREEGYYLYP